VIAQQLGPQGDWARLPLSSKNASFAFPFKAPEAGTAALDWYASPHGGRQARDAHAEPVILATGALTFSAAATKTMRITFTKAGMLLWKRAKRLRLIAKGTFTPVGSTPIAVTRTFALKK
jgi:hypothetical protein